MISTKTESRFGGRFLQWLPLGEGAEGKLFRVTDRWTGRVCALKVARDGTDGGAALVREYELLTRFRHPCLIESLDLVRDGDMIAHLLEYVPAVEPSRLWELGGEPAIRAAVTQALRGLRYLHRQGWVHGDVAPGNILVWQEGERWRAKVADLGLALTSEQAATSGLRGTIDYVSPETARGEGFGFDADLFGVAASAAHWIDGQSPWSEYEPHEVPPRVARLSEPLSARRGVGRDLSRLLGSLGDPDPSRRHAATWEGLREFAEAWGTPVLQAGVHGLDAVVDTWERWFADVQPGQTAAVIIRGRLGTGRSTLASTLSRRMVAGGWTSFSDLPLASVRDWLEDVQGDPDPVRLAKELRRRFEGNDVVLLWPENLADLEERLYQAFAVGRESGRTAVVRVESGVGPAEASWLEEAVRSQVVTWEGLPAEALSAVRADLFGVEEGLDAGADDLETPLALELKKRAQLVGGDVADVDETQSLVEREVTRVWKMASPEAREALTLMAWSERGWTTSSVAVVLGWLPAAAAGYVEELERLLLVRPEHRDGRLRFCLTDSLTRAAVVRARDQVLDPDRVTAIEAGLHIARAHGHDLELALNLFRRGCEPGPYTLAALDRGLSDGRYDQVLEFGVASPVGDRKLLQRLLRAAKQLGKFPDELRFLNELIDMAGPTDRLFDLCQRRASVRFTLGDWKSAVSELEEIGEWEVEGEKVLEAKIQRAEVLWQAGEFGRADELYEELDGLSEVKFPSLYLRYCVGRARQSAQRGLMGEASNWIDRAESKLPALSSSDPMFLNTKAGVARAHGSYAQALEVSGRAARESERVADWQAFVMSSSRCSVDEAALGRFYEAYQRSSEAEAAAIAFGSRRMAALSGCYRARLLSETGNPEAALSKASWATALGEKHNDSTLWTTGAMVSAFCASQYGLQSIATQCCSSLERSGVKGMMGVVRGVRCLTLMCSLEWEQAAVALQDAVAYVGTLDHSDDELHYRHFLAEALVMTGRVSEGRQTLHDLLEEDTRRDYESHTRIARILNETWGFSERALEDRIKSVNEQLDQMMDHGAILDVCYHAHAVLTGFQKDASRDQLLSIRKKILEIFQRVVNSFEDPQLKREFLGAPRYVETLTLLR